VECTKLRNIIINNLQEQGFLEQAEELRIAVKSENYRVIQANYKTETLRTHLNFLMAQNGQIRETIINGKDIDPQRIALELRTVESGKIEENIFKWWNFVWWSIPYVRPYGRQMRFVLWDTHHDKPFGLIGLQSAPLKMNIRDTHLGISRESRDWWINMSMSAQRVGALPPYNQLLGGKMVAMALAAKELREFYREKYLHSQTILRQRELPADLLFITTTGAFGKSSIYNRVKYQNDHLIEFLGYTQGSGAFHISEKIYQEIIRLLRQEGVNVGRGYGFGPSRKRQLLSIGFKYLNLPDFEYHGIKRAFYLISHVNNLKAVIRNNTEPEFKEYNLPDLCEYWKERWAIKRAKNQSDWKTFNAQNFWEQTQTELERLASG
jgi:hypothetical protein